MSHASHRRGADRTPVAHLDELFVAEEPAAPIRRRIDQHRPWLVRATLQTFIGLAVVYTSLAMLNLEAPYALILAVCAGVVLVRLAVKETAEPAWLRARDQVRPPTARRREERWTDHGDGMLDAVRRWDRRLDWGVAAPERFTHTVSTRLAELADERLRQHHGITRASDPARARALLGDALWQILAGPLERVPTSQQMAAALTRLEQL